MKFLEKYPNMLYADGAVSDERDGVIRSRRDLACCVCGEPTEYIDLDYEDSFCSEECVAEMDERCSKYAKENCQEAPEGCAETRSCPFG